MDTSTARELLRVLEYPKFGLSPADRDEILAEYLPYAELVSLPEQDPPPAQTSDLQNRIDSGEGLDAAAELRDPDDRMFLDLAVRSHADALITGDGGLLALAERLPFDVLTPAQARALL